MFGPQKAMSSFHEFSICVVGHPTTSDLQHDEWLEVPRIKENLRPLASWSYNAFQHCNMFRTTKRQHDNMIMITYVYYVEVEVYISEYTATYLRRV